MNECNKQTHAEKNCLIGFFGPSLVYVYGALYLFGAPSGTSRFLAGNATLRTFA